MHENPVVEYRTGSLPKLTVVLVHGRTLTPAYMQALAERLALPDVRYVFPVADGNTWFPKPFTAPLAENEPALSAALAHYESVVAGLLAAGTALDRMVVGGFSQGASLTSEFLHRYPRRYAGALLWTGGLVGPDETEWAVRRSLSGMHACVTTSEVDPFVPPHRARRTVDWLLASGAIVTAR
ncbi:MAG TPA: hypothetical protein VHZ56_09380, partial [Devosia sp.]|nr:hypothetical protein [Devosia sp.]